MICGYAEILKHAIINDKKFFYWLKNNTKKILKNNYRIILCYKKSCKIKLFYVNKDVGEKNKNDTKFWSYVCSCNRSKK